MEDTFREFVLEKALETKATLHSQAEAESLPTAPESSAMETPSNMLPSSELKPSFSYQADSPFVIELCAGSARVTSYARAIGLKDSFGVDHVKQQNCGRIHVADLTTKAGKTLCRQWLQSKSLLGVFMAPPCGTCSRARSIPLRHPSGKPLTGPKPLRSEEFPDGLPNLNTLDRIRVSAANRLYHFLTEVALDCLKRDLIVVIENPRRSLYWRASLFQPLAEHLQYTAHQACAYGSTRPKWTVLAHNHAAFAKINHCCPGVSPKHKHDAWGLTSTGFATGQETAYPLQLAYTIAHAFASIAVDRGWSPPGQPLTPPSKVHYAFLRAVVGQQPKASRLPPVLSEYAEVIHRHFNPQTLPIQPGQLLPSDWQDIPAGSKFLKYTPLRLTGGDGNRNVGEVEAGKVSGAFGVYRSPDVFVKEAVNMGHPIKLQNSLPKAFG